MAPTAGNGRRATAGRLSILLSVLAVWAMAASCGDPGGPPEGLRQTSPTGGPTVRFSLEGRPFPEMPFPTDLLTRSDPSTATGRRLNLPEQGATEAETEVRRALNERIGWGLIQPITVGFDKPLNIEYLTERHHEPQPRFEDDAVYLINIDEESPNYGKLRLLDLGRGNYPVTHAEPDQYFPNDPRAEGTNLLFETVAETDTNENGRLDPMEDTDDDGTWDRPNTLDPDGDPYEPGQLLEFYERETNTLIMRPVEPLAAKTTYAVVLTKALRGVDGNEVQSPFPSINHTEQTETLQKLRELLPYRFPDRFGERLHDVQFAWSFTTGDPTADMRAIRAGLYGDGPFARFAEQFPAELTLVHNSEKPDDETPMTFNLDPVLEFILPIAADQVGDAGAETVEAELEEVAYVVSGSFESPYFLGDSDGLSEEGAAATLPTTNPQVTDEHFEVDRQSGEAKVRTAEVTFNCTVPKKGPGSQPPFPVVIYSHAISSTRLELLLVAGAFARLGMATCAIDAAGHGVQIPDRFQEDLDEILESLGLPNLGGMIQHHRARDVRNDGTADSAGNYFTADMLHSRSMIRQTAIDQMQFIRILRSFDGESRWPDAIDTDNRFVQAREDIVASWDQDGDGESEIRGDFNGDGTVDFGGDRAYAGFGTSLGGLQTGVLAGIEPTIEVAATNAGGGGLADVAARTTIGHVANGVILRMVGPLLIGDPVYDADGEPTGQTELSFVLPTGIDRTTVPIGTVEGLEDGDAIVVRNLAMEGREAAPAAEARAVARVRDGQFRLSVAADALDATARRALTGFDPKNDVRTELLGCVTSSLCDEMSCDDGHYCSADGECKPMSRCVVDADADDKAPSTEAAEALKRHTIDEPREFGDPLVIEVYSEDGELKETVDQFRRNTIYQNVLYPEGSALAALAAGWGLQRQTPRFRKFIDIAHLLLGVADPAVYATHYQKDPLDYPYEEEKFQTGRTDSLIVGTLGDQTVPINTGLMMARASGALDSRGLAPAYGSTPNKFLIDNYVYEGIHWLDRFPDYPNTLFDPDDLDRGMFGQPTPDAVNPLRATVETENGVSGLRLPYLDTSGAHTFNAPRPDAAFDVPSFMTNQVGWYFATGGTELRDDPCLQVMPLTDACGFFNPETYAGPDLGRDD